MFGCIVFGWSLAMQKDQNFIQTVTVTKYNFSLDGMPGNTIAKTKEMWASYIRPYRCTQIA